MRQSKAGDWIRPSQLKCCCCAAQYRRRHEMRTPRPQEIYRHFKGRLYQVLTLARHSETGEVLVVYQALYGDYAVFARPLSMFCSEVDAVKYPGAMQKERFQLWKGSEEAHALFAGESPVTGSRETRAKQTEEERQTRAKQPEEDRQTRAMQPDGIFSQKEKPAEPSVQAAEEEVQLDPRLLRFLDANRMEEKMEILDSMQGDVTDEMIDIMAISLDTEIVSGEASERIAALRETIQMRLRFESSRLRE
ncbi:MAG: DUF1653 domain-containing protein [Lachnospiraceae bacterium]|nr:DUF1653 domain-containing protein [Lachnospiraceae bacterium]